MTIQRTQKGFSLVEVLIAIGILLLATVGPMTIAARAAQSAQYAREQNTAFFLAQEGIEAVMTIRAEAGMSHIGAPSNPSNAWVSNASVSNCQSSGSGCRFHFDDEILTDDFAQCTGNNCRLYLSSSGRARYSHNSSGTPTPFTRRVFIDPAGTGVRIRSEVEWQPSVLTSTKKVTLETFLYDIYNTN